MKARHDMLALAGWYLMRAPLLLPRVLHNAQAIHADTAALLSRWIIVRTFPTQKECEAHLSGGACERCIASDDPRLKEK